jgi:hypothetical protein
MHHYVLELAQGPIFFDAENEADAMRYAARAVRGEIEEDLGWCGASELDAIYARSKRRLRRTRALGELHRWIDADGKIPCPTFVCRVSYNGRLWAKDGTPIPSAADGAVPL